ncbi:hypothetical protein GQ44DRAFT_756593 [Phaeosphaeriaceae sp. PMI808]|nr:hypothetical protein GQ44DRAFT_756593 [Phaeosphaeriaceae sp. PMI808]
MPNSPGSTDFALQICFGIFGILSTIATLASLHHRDSLDCVLIRHLIPTRNMNRDGDIEMMHRSYEVADEHVHVIIPFERRLTLPPAYEQSDSESQSSLSGTNGTDTYQYMNEVTITKALNNSD